ncbi:MAG: Gfo/Idh/MocA family oxidoreductase [Clostridia bacterium]|nr:Gfo/Idh/MocA family oxidoreductase [Clostridia bacterium]
MTHKGGIIGFGGMGSWHYEHAKETPVNYVAVYDVDPERLKVAREQGLKAYETLDAFLADDSFDVVLVATPNNFHHDMVIAALEAGKNVVCEKPVAMSSAELLDMTAAAERAGKVFTVHQNRRWDADLDIVRRAIDQDLLGELFTVESRVHGQNGAMYGWRAFKVAGGGMMLDWGVHQIDQLIHLFGRKVESVFCTMAKIKTTEVEDYFKLIIKMKDGLTLQIETGTYNLIQMPRWYVCGSKGALQIDTWGTPGKVVRAKKEEFEWTPVIIHTAAGPTRTMSPRPKDTLEELEIPEQWPDWKEFYANVAAVIDGEAKELLVKPDEALYVMRIMEAAFKSAETGEAVMFE